MNGTLKRVAIGVMVLFALLLINVNYVQVIKAEELREDPRNRRAFFARYENDRGWITAGDVVLARSKDTKSDLRFVREYPKGEVYAHVTGFFAPENATEIEAATGSLLDGTDSKLAVRRFIDLITNKPLKGANVELTINPAAQEAAYNALRRDGKRGAVVAINPKTGAILALVSVPSYDPNLLSIPDRAKVVENYNKLDANKNKPLVNRAINDTYAPGSTYKVVTAAAFLSDDDSRGPETMVPAPQVLNLPNTNVGLPNYGGAACGAGRVTLVFALERSCNTPFGQIGMDLGYEAMNEQAKKFGVGEELNIPMRVGGVSDFGKEEDLAALAQASIGQRSNRMSPLQMAMIAAGIANDGTVMAPYLVKQVTGPDNSKIITENPQPLGEAVSEDVARKLKDMMVSVVDRGTATRAQIEGIRVGGKTGTAETAEGRDPHAWFISFAPYDNPEVAVAVFIESGSAGGNASGGGTAAPIARDVMRAVLRQ
ncbi:peptidoglycan D,D-transpeptidase FtsI family protein [Rhizohabitans arisaemae]|uniref:peptidoglycan D,D-transpeptidase FtsI family protein n=1 Tax=Rhizohabitans arisaemae TaxID=2720610 RepID=UPI0024B043AB|nr:penicillin-binding protein 2 [Rhizohabitans arisaemae]